MLVHFIYAKDRLAPNWKLPLMSSLAANLSNLPGMQNYGSERKLVREKVKVSLSQRLSRGFRSLRTQTMTIATRITKERSTPTKPRTNNTKKRLLCMSPFRRLFNKTKSEHSVATTTTEISAPVLTTTSSRNSIGACSLCFVSLHAETGFDASNRSLVSTETHTAYSTAEPNVPSITLSLTSLASYPLGPASRANSVSFGTIRSAGCGFYSDCSQQRKNGNSNSTSKLCL